MSIFFKKLKLSEFTSATVTACYLFNAGCIHTTSYENKSIDLLTKTELTTESFNKIKIQSSVYLPSKFPLSDFWGRLKKGEFKDAFNRMDLDYKRSNVSDEVLENIIAGGFIPAYVEITNYGETPISFDEKSFALTNENTTIKAFYSDALPREFKKFNPSAAAANVINTGIVIVGFAAVLAAMFIVETNSSGGNLQFPNSDNNTSSNNAIYNDTHKTTRIDYKTYLLKAAKLNPKESLSGLVFFYAPDQVGLHEFKLIYLPQNQN